MKEILTETLDLVRQGARQIDLPLSRLSEFLLAGTDHRLFTMEEMEEFRQRCIDGEAKVWGVPVTFH